MQLTAAKAKYKKRAPRGAKVRWLGAIGVWLGVGRRAAGREAVRGVIVAGECRYITLSVPDVGMLKRAELVLKWEARRRATTVGWAFYSLLVESVDFESYPRRLGARIGRLVEVADRQRIEAAKRRHGGRTKPAAEHPVATRNATYRVQFATPECYKVVRSTLMYEAVLQGLTVSQAACRMIESAAKTWSYPREVRVQVEKVDRELAMRAVEYSMREINGACEDKRPGKRARRTM